MCHSICHVYGVYVSVGCGVLICAESLLVSREMEGVGGVFLSLVVRSVVFPRPVESATGMTC